MKRESMEFDVLIIGGGPSGLSASIRLRQLALKQGRDLSVCVIEKGSEIGAHILSGAVLEPRALDELIPDWRQKEAPIVTPAIEDRLIFLTEKRAVRLPTPSPMQNDGNFIISLGKVCRWLAQQAEALGVEIYPGFSAADILYDEAGAVCGVVTGDMGRDRNGKQTDQFQPGMNLMARQTLFAEGARGSLSQQVMARFHLCQGRDPQTYGIGIKEIWDVDPSVHHPGRVTHTIGWPLTTDTYGGSFVYHLEGGQLAIGFVIGLDYENPHLSPFDEFQRFKTHPQIRPLLENGRRVAYGARALNEGGFQSIPKLTFPGGLLIGCAAGFLNVPKIKGTHTAMKSGMVAAEAVFDALTAGQNTNSREEIPQDTPQTEVTAYEHKLRASWIWPELYAVRNVRPSFHLKLWGRFGLWGGLAYSAVSTYLFRGKEPWTFHHHEDHTCLKPANQMPEITYPQPDGIVSFDKLSSVYLSSTYHEDNQPCHLTLKDSSVPITVNLSVYEGPEARFCPAGVYEFVDHPETQTKRLQINAQNCVHCKTCDIKDLSQNIVWRVPQGGEGPNYPNM